MLASKQVSLLPGALHFLVFLQVPFGELAFLRYDASTLEGGKKTGGVTLELYAS